MNRAVLSLIALALVLAPPSAASVADGAPEPGVPTSLAGTGIARQELLVIPSFEHSRNRGFQYNPEEFGYGPGHDYHAERRTTEGTVFVGYGLTRNVAVEFEAGRGAVELRKSADDTTAMPARLRESGTTGVTARISWLMRPESAGRAAWFGFVDASLPHDRARSLIGRRGVSWLVGVGAERTSRWGTVSARHSFEWDTASISPLDWGEFAVSWNRDVRRHTRATGAIEGQLDEIWLVLQVDQALGRRLSARFRNGVGLTRTASGLAPEAGLMWRLPAARSRGGREHARWP